MIFYGIVFSYGIAFLAHAGKLTPWVPAGDFFLMALATQRLTQLFTYDTVTQFLRDAFSGFPRSSFLGTLGALLRCPWCTGLWFALVVVFGYFATPYAWYGILILALGSVGSFFQVLINMVGWYAEGKKQEVEYRRAHEDLPQEGE